MNRNDIAMLFGGLSRPVIYQSLWSSNQSCHNVYLKSQCQCGDQIYQDIFFNQTDSCFEIRFPKPASRFKIGLAMDLVFAQAGDITHTEFYANEQLVSQVDICWGDALITHEFDLDNVYKLVVKCFSTAGQKHHRSHWIAPTVTYVDGQSELVGKSPSKRRPQSLLPAFQYGDEYFDPNVWESISRDISSNSIGKTFISPDGKLKLDITINIYDRFNAIEYRPVLENISNDNTKLVKDFYSLSLQHPLEYVPNYGHGGQYRPVMIRRVLGTKSDYLDFCGRPFLMDQRPDCDRMSMISDEGRPSATWLPFFGIDFDELNGLNIGIGWTGAWRADFCYKAGCLMVNSGMLNTSFHMEPGEMFIQPNVLMMFREDESVEVAQNHFRHLLLEHFSPRSDVGSITVNPISVGIFGGISTDTHLLYIKKFKEHKFPYEFYGIDAGWYGDGHHKDVFSNTWAEQVGNWWVNDAHPNGLAPICRAAKSNGMKVWLWYELERAVAGTELTIKHPEWFLQEKESRDLLLDLGNPEALEWAIDTSIKLFTENGIDQLHQDFNFNILPHLASLDKPGRKGVAEIKYLMGWYKYMDTLQEKIPNFTMDLCASGGRRIDFESMKRGAVIWRSDVQCFPRFDPIQNQIQNFYLQDWAPLNCGGIWLFNDEYDDYAFFSAVANAISDCSFIYQHRVPSESYFYDYHASRIREAKRIREYYSGNYYKLTREPESCTNWYAYQFAKNSGGMFIVFRRPESPNETEFLRLREIDVDAEYELETFGEEHRKRIQGAELQNYIITLAPRSFRLFYYKRA